MFGRNFTKKINNLFKYEKKNFTLIRSLKTAATRNKADEQAIEVLNLLKRKSVKKILFTLGATYFAAFTYFGTQCLWEDNMSAKKYAKFRNLDYVLAGGCLFVLSAFTGSNYIYGKTNPASQVSKLKIPVHLKFIPILGVLGFGLLLNENNILVSMESLVGLAALAYLLNNIRLVLNAKQRRPIITPLLAFGMTLSFLYTFKAYFVVRQRINFKSFLYDFNNRKEHLQK